MERHCCYEPNCKAPADVSCTACERSLCKAHMELHLKSQIHHDVVEAKEIIRGLRRLDVERCADEVEEESFQLSRVAARDMREAVEYHQTALHYEMQARAAEIRMSSALSHKAIAELDHTLQHGIDTMALSRTFDFTNRSRIPLLLQFEQQHMLPNDLFAVARQRSSASDRIDLLIQTKTKAKEPAQRDELKTLLHLAGNQALGEGNFLAARLAFSVSSEICRVCKNEQDLAVELNLLGLATSGLGEHTLAISIYEEAAELCQKLKENRRRAWILRNMGNLQLYALAAYKQAVETFTEAACSFEKANCPRDQAGALNSKAKAYIKQGSMEAALEVLDASERIFNQVHDVPGIVEVRCTRGRLLFAEGKYTEAIQCFTNGKWMAQAFALSSDQQKLSKFLQRAETKARTKY